MQSGLNSHETFPETKRKLQRGHHQGSSRETLKYLANTERTFKLHRHDNLLRKTVKQVTFIAIKRDYDRQAFSLVEKHSARKGMLKRKSIL